MSESTQTSDTLQLMEERVRGLCREYNGARLAGALLELAREATESPSGLLGTISGPGALRINALTPDLKTSDILGLEGSIVLAHWTDSWARGLLGNTTVVINEPHVLEPAGLEMRRSLAVPFVFAGDMVGVLYLGNKADEYREHDAWLLERIAHWAAIEVKELVDTDAETTVMTIADEPTMPTGESAIWLGNKFQLLFELAPIGMVLSELDGRFLLPNHAFLELIGYTRDEAITLSEVDLSPSGFAHREQRVIIQQLTERGRFGPLEHRYRRRDGSFVRVLLHGLVIKAVDDTPYRWTFVQDITETKNIEMALQRSRQAADAAARAKADFVATVSHELRTPINGVVGLSSLLMDTDLDGQQRDYVASMQRSGRALLDLVNDVLDFAKLEGGRIMLELSPLELEELVERVVAVARQGAQDKGLDVTLAYQPTLPPRLIGDAGRVRQVLNNLLSNAVKFTESGAINVRVAALSEGESDIIVEFQVGDTGIGIPEDMRERIFHSFTQADASTTRRFGGTGLGLAISRRLVDLMGGRLGLESEVGRGSTFFFTTRFKRVLDPIQHGDTEKVEAPFPAVQQRAESAAEPRRWRVLVAEDNPVNQLVLVRMLERLGYQVAAVTNGLEAIAALRQDAYDVVLMDCHMPEMDGFEATLRVRAGLAGPPDVPIIAITAGANESRCADVGMNGYITKPIDPEFLGAALARWLEC